MKKVWRFNPGDILTLKKPHPCLQRSHQFLVMKIGADIKIKCLGCQGVLLLTRDHLHPRIQAILHTNPQPTTPIK
jgi:hypothetical protein